MIDYEWLLLEDYGINVPEGVPQYLQEEFYKTLEEEDIEESQKFARAKSLVDELLVRFPFLALTYEMANIQDNQRIQLGLSKKSNVPDGTIEFCNRRERLVCYVGGEIVSKNLSLQKLKETVETKYGITQFNIILGENYDKQN